MRTKIKLNIYHSIVKILCFIYDNNIYSYYNVLIIIVIFIKINLGKLKKKGKFIKEAANLSCYSTTVSFAFLLLLCSDNPDPNICKLLL